MSEYLAFQEFCPSEETERTICLWCKSKGDTNKAHIISKKLTQTTHGETVLKNTVCSTCNSKTGKIEEWILRNTPLAWARFFLYLRGDPSTIGLSIPSYVYSNSFKEWIVFDLLGKNRSRRIMPQLIIRNNSSLFISDENPEEIIIKLRTYLIESKVKYYLNVKLPFNFTSRFLYADLGIVAVAQNKEQVDLLKGFKWTEENWKRTGQPNRVLLDPGEERQHFRWSKINWGKFCAKIAFEMLSLCEGASSCSGKEYDTLRKFVLDGHNNSSQEVIFNATGPIGNPTTLCGVNIDLSNSQNCHNSLPSFIYGNELGMHCITLYQFSGYICASVSISGFPTSVIVLAGPDCHMSDLFTVIYDEMEDRFHFLKLAYDQSRPVIPIPIEGQSFKKIAREYHLKSIST